MRRRGRRSVSTGDMTSVTEQPEPGSISLLGHRVTAQRLLPLTCHGLRETYMWIRCGRLRVRPPCAPRGACWGLVLVALWAMPTRAAAQRLEVAGGLAPSIGPASRRVEAPRVLVLHVPMLTPRPQLRLDARVAGMIGSTERLSGDVRFGYPDNLTVSASLVARVALNPGPSGPYAAVGVGVTGESERAGVARSYHAALGTSLGRRRAFVEVSVLT